MAEDIDRDAIAIVGMSGRFPGAAGIEQFWQNLLDGTESISNFAEEELRAAGIAERYLRDPNYVRAAPIIDHVDSLDAGYFGISNREAEILDPQHRVFLETCSTALQHAGQDPASFDGRIGVYAGAKENIYLKHNLEPNAAVMRAVGELAVHISNHTDYLSTGVAYRLNLSGPAVSMVTACSTSLVATHLACRALRAGECEMALAGGVEIILPVVHGYLYHEGGILAPDAHIRPFDANARGTVFGSGSGAVVLKRLADALADRDTIHAVILGSAVNNDGSDKGAFSAPSKGGQLAVIRTALLDAAIEPTSVGYVEAHGTGTLVGDPIEVSALTEAYGGEPGSCPIASAKGNVGHLGAAAGVCGLIKATHCVREGLVPPNINFAEPNPRIDFATSPFYVNTELRQWRPDGRPRRAAISSFGIGGTNAHMIIEQPPTPAATAPTRRRPQLITISARTTTALDTATAQLGRYLGDAQAELADVAHTLNLGRAQLPVRRIMVAADREDAARRLAGADAAPLFTRTVATRSEREVVFLLPGQGSQYPGMAQELYRQEPVFAAEIDRCADVLAAHNGLDLRELLFSSTEDALNQTAVTQPALYAVEYALVTLLREWGITPAAMVGHSVGEYVAAAVAGVFSVEDGLRLVADRGALMQALEPGSMLAIMLSEDLLLPMLPPELDLAAVNAPGMCVVSGTDEDVRRLRDELAVQGVGARVLHTSHAFHSRHMDPILEEFRQRVAAVPLRAPALPYVANLTGKFISADEATDPDHWLRHLRHCVRFSDSLQLLAEQGRYVYLEVGPGRVLSGLVSAHAEPGAPAESAPIAVPTMRHPHEDRDDVEMLLDSVGRAWAAGAPVDWRQFWRADRRRRVPLPTYPYERQRYWVEPDAADGSGPAEAVADDSGPFYLPVWREVPPPTTDPAVLADPDTTWLVFAPADDLGVDGLVGRLREAGASVLVARPGEEYTAGTQEYTLRPTESADYARLLSDAAVREPAQVRIVHAWTVGPRPAGRAEDEYAQRWLDLGFHSVLAALQETARLLAGTPLDLCVVSSDMQDVLGDGAVEPAKASVLGVVKVAGKEFEALRCRSVDLSLDAPPELSADRLLAEVTAAGHDELVAYRGRKRWVMSYGPVELAEPEGLPPFLVERGRYLITGGLGGLGLVLAEELARLVQARLVLVGRSGLPDRAEWESLVADGTDADPVVRRIRAVRAIEEAGGEVLVCPADVTDDEDLRAVRASAEAAYGGIDGVFHLAAIAGGGMLETRRREQAEAVFAPKVAGLYALERVFAPDLFVFYSTIAVVHGDFGLGDYTGANAVLDAFAQSRWARGRRTISINYSPWIEAGMAYEIHGPAILSELASGTAATAVAHPLLRNRRGAVPEPVTFEVDMDPERWVLAEHRLSGLPTMPGTGIVELVRAACEELTGDAGVEIKDLQFLRPVAAEPGVQVRAVLRGDGQGGFQVTVSGHAPGAVTTEYARGHVRPLGGESAERQDLGALLRDCEVDTTPAFESDLGGLEFGPRWDNIVSRRTTATQDLDVVTIELPEAYRADLGEYVLHPALLDSAAAMGMRLPGDGRYLPFGYGRISVRGPLPARCHAVIRPLERTSGEILQADVSVVDDGGAELVGIQGYTLVRLDETRATEAAPVQEQATAAVTVENRMREGEALGGVTTADGNRALRTVLQPGVGPQVVFCPEGLHERRKRTARITRAALLEQAGAAAPTSAGTRNLETPYVEPQTETERALARIWQNALWLDKVGALDDFFDLGGNSLVAVQLVAEVSRAFETDVPVAQLFELRTIRALAAAIEAALLERIANLTDEEALAELRALEGSA
jgi:acyl transferase domain-containing protein